MNDRRAWKNKGAVESERRMDERVRAIAARDGETKELSDRVEYLLTVLKGIAESAESRDALQVWAWRVFKDSDPERWGLVVEEPGVGSQCVPNFTKERKP